MTTESLIDNTCPRHGRFIGTNCTYCDYPPLFGDAAIRKDAAVNRGGIPATSSETLNGLSLRKRIEVIVSKIVYSRVTPQSELDEVVDELIGIYGSEKPYEDQKSAYQAGYADAKQKHAPSEMLGDKVERALGVLRAIPEMEPGHHERYLAGLNRAVGIFAEYVTPEPKREIGGALPGAFASSDASGLPHATIPDDIGLVNGVCSNKSRTSLQNNHSKGSQHWKSDPWHIRASGTSTLCGIDSLEWLTIGPIKPDHNLCQRCAKKANVNSIEDGSASGN